MFSKHFICARTDYCDYEHHVPAPLFRKTFSVSESPSSAKLTICGLGFYELYINGIHITRGALTPYISNPDDLLYYDCYDLLPYVQEGDNVIGIILGNGFQNPFGGFIWDFEKVAWRGAPRVAFSLEMCIDEKVTVLEADETVRVAESPITFDDLRIGAFYDANKEIDGWNTIDFDDSSWKFAQRTTTPRGEARICEADPIVIYDRKKPIAIQHIDDFCFCCEENSAYANPIERTRVRDTYLYDFGENNSGVCQLKIHGTPGQKIILRFAELLVDGKFSISTTIFQRPESQIYYDYPQMDVYICNGKEEEIFIPPFTYHGFRYVLVEGITPEQATDDLLTYLIMSSELPERGRFCCSDDVINRLFDMTVRSDRSNFIFFPTDCPHREKNGWTADAALSAEHMLLHMKATPNYREWMRAITKAQREDGALPGIIPTGGWGFGWSGPGWDCVCVYIPYYVYQYDGDVSLFQENSVMIKKYLTYMESQRDVNGLVAFGLGDWCQPDKEKGILSPLHLTGSVMAFDIARKAAYMFQTIGDFEASERADILATSIRDAIRNHLIDFDEMVADGNCQTSQALIVAMDILDEDEKPKAVEQLVKFIHEQDDHLFCGVIGARQLFHVLAAYGYVDLAIKMIVRPDYPSYGMWVAEGATTLAEEFTRPGQYINSLNHHFWGDIASFFMKELAGLRPNPYVRDIREYRIEPLFAETLNEAQAAYDSTWGTVSVKWVREGDKISLIVEAPPEIYGKICIPEPFRLVTGESEWELKSGRYSLVQRY